MKRTMFCLFAGLCLAFGLPSTIAFSQGFELTALASKNLSLGNGPFSQPAINKIGEAAYVAIVRDDVERRNEHVLFLDDGTVATAIFNFDDDSPGWRPFASQDVNDTGQVAGKSSNLSGGANPGFILLIEPDGTANIIAEGGQGMTSDVVEFSAELAINNAGQIAVLAKNSDGSQSILRFDGTTPVEIARSSSPDFRFFSAPSINDLGRVAFSAQKDEFGRDTFSGDGGPLTNEGMTSAGGGAGAPQINSAGLILDGTSSASPLLFTAQGGVVNIVVDGTEDPVFFQLGGYGFNDFEDFVFRSKASRAGALWNIFVGNDPIADEVIRGGDDFLGRPVTIMTMGQHAISNTGQIVFLIQTGEGTPADPITSYVVLATPEAATNQPPLADAGPGQTVEATGALTNVSLDGSGSSDPDGDTLSFEWIGLFGTVMGESPTVTLPPGTHIITLTVTDPDGLSDSDTVTVAVAPRQVAIDIKPGSDPNCFNNDGKGVIPVAILGSDGSNGFAPLNVADINASSVSLQGLAVAVRGRNKLMSHFEDVNGDGIEDLVMQIEDQDGTFVKGSGTAIVTGSLLDGTLIEGSDKICIVQ
jgi:hypothetical protein